MRLLSRGTTYLTGAVLAGFLLSVVFDRVLGTLHSRRDVAEPWPNQLKLLPPNVRLSDGTTEFHYTASVNRLGFRGKAFSMPRDSTYRVIAIGDSFTFGSGVNDDESWPVVLEQQLRAGGARVEVANLGAPGASPADHAALAERAVPTMRPHLVVIAILQGEDLGQVSWTLHPPPHLPQPPLLESVWKIAVRVVRSLYPNLMGLIDSFRTWDDITETALREARRDAVAARKAALTSEHRGRYNQLDDSLRKLVESGQLNPQLVFAALADSQFYSLSTELNTSRARESIDEMGRHLSRIRAVAERMGAKVIVLSVPHGPYADRRVYGSFRRYGYALAPDALTSSAPDSAIRLAAAHARLPFSQITDSVRKLAAITPLYFELDSHFNAAGHRVYGDLVAPIVAMEIPVAYRRRSGAAVSR